MDISKHSEGELLRMVSEILSRPGNITEAERLELLAINDEILRRDKEK